MSRLQSARVSHIQNEQEQKVEMRVPLYSYGCERKIKKALYHFKGLSSVDVDFRQQKVSVTGVLDRDEVLAAVKAKRKNAEFWSSYQDRNLCKNEQVNTKSSKGKTLGSDVRNTAFISENTVDPKCIKPHTVEKKKKKVTFREQPEFFT